jgi:hypothetical protein
MKHKPGKYWEKVRMKMQGWLTVTAVISIAASSAVLAAESNVTFRAPAAFQGVIQSTDVAGKPAYEFEGFDGADLVNLALGTDLGTTRTNEVLAIEFTCNSNSVSLVVFDKATSNNLAVIATSFEMSVVKQQDDDATAFPNRERFAAEMNVASLGNDTNGLVSGFIDIAGRVYLSPTNGCPRALLVDTDRKDDGKCGDPVLITDKLEKIKGKIALYGGRGHFHGSLDVISSTVTNTILVPDGALSIERVLAP